MGEPVRLAIVDRLGPGDASPGELAEAVGVGSNLLAHHLKVLQGAGVIRRVRSEGDGRRSYVQLCLDDPIVLAAAQAGLADRPPAAAVPRVLFVCTANTARSQLAAARWNAISRCRHVGQHPPAARVHPRAVALVDRPDSRGRADTDGIEQVRDGDLMSRYATRPELDPGLVAPVDP